MTKFLSHFKDTIIGIFKKIYLEIKYPQFIFNIVSIFFAITGIFLSIDANNIRNNVDTSILKSKVIEILLNEPYQKEKTLSDLQSQLGNHILLKNKNCIGIWHEFIDFLIMEIKFNTTNTNDYDYNNEYYKKIHLINLQCLQPLIKVD